MDYEQKYLKYKQKYNLLKSRLYGGKKNYGLNILGTELKPCPIIDQNKNTGFYRDNYCMTCIEDSGTHVVSALMDDEFLKFTQSKGNDLITSISSFPGLVAGDRWCLCALRWKQAYEAGKAPKIFAKSTSDVALKYIDKKILLEFAIDIK